MDCAALALDDDAQFRGGESDGAIVGGYIECSDGPIRFDYDAVGRMG